MEYNKAIITRYLQPIRLSERHIIVESGEKMTRVTTCT